jgi:AAA15 family ATPase/GTPase
MIRDISIQNFRCFENTSISGFKNVNLITGKNNAGKTALLEALTLSSLPIPDTIPTLKSWRGESLKFDKYLPQRTWDSLFLNQDNSKNISIYINEDNNQSTQINIALDQDPIQSFTEIDSSNNTSKIAGIYVDLLSNNESKTSVIKAEIIINSKENYEFSLIATNQGIIGKKFQISDTRNISFFGSFDNGFNANLAIAYDEARLNNREQEVLKGIQTIDPSIQIIESFNIGSPMLHLTRKDEERLPLSLFGDAIKRVTAIILSIINSNVSILFVDEVENGIHYTNQANLWRMLFRLSKELNVQIFATTHSLEMLKAFTEVGLESEFSDLAAHFEMARSVKTGQIIGIKRDMETLEYSLSHDRGVRGE